MKVTFLGTGTSQGVPIIGCDCRVCRSVDYRDQRLRSSILITAPSGENIIIDTGPDFRQQMLRHNVNRLDAILFTHEHKDHIAGLDDVRAYNFIQQANVPVYAHPRTLARLQLEFDYAFGNCNYPGVPVLDGHAVTQQPFFAGNLTIVPFMVMHHKLPIFGYRVNNFAYITDAKTIDEVSLEAIKGVEVLVINALRREPHISHFNLDEALEQIERIGAKKVYLTHISHLLGLHKDILAELPPHIEPAFDGLIIEV